MANLLRIAIGLVMVILAAEVAWIIIDGMLAELRDARPGIGGGPGGLPSLL